MDSKKLGEMIKAKDGSVRAFCRRVGVNHQSFYYASRTDERLDKMSVTMFIEVANGLEMTPEKLAKELGFWE